MHKKKTKKRVISLLSREEVEFMDRLGMDSFFSSGRKLTRVEIISALVNAAISLGISADGIRTKQELIDRLLVGFQSKSERRKFPRLNKSLIVGLRKMDTFEKYATHSTKDVSLGGFKIEVCFLDRPLCINQLIEVTIADPKDATLPIKAIGRIAWLKENEEEHSHEVGIMIAHMKEEDKTRFEKYLSAEQEEEDKVVNVEAKTVEGQQ